MCVHNHRLFHIVYLIFPNKISTGSFLGLGIKLIRPCVSVVGRVPCSTLSNITLSRKLVCKSLIKLCRTAINPWRFVNFEMFNHINDFFYSSALKSSLVFPFLTYQRGSSGTKKYFWDHSLFFQSMVFGEGTAIITQLLTSF